MDRRPCHHGLYFPMRLTRRRYARRGKCRVLAARRRRASQDALEVRVALRRPPAAAAAGPRTGGGRGDSFAPETRWPAVGNSHTRPICGEPPGPPRGAMPHASSRATAERTSRPGSGRRRPGGGPAASTPRAARAPRDQLLSSGRSGVYRRFELVRPGQQHRATSRGGHRHLPVSVPRSAAAAWPSSGRRHIGQHPGGCAPSRDQRLTWRDRLVSILHGHRRYHLDQRRLPAVLFLQPGPGRVPFQDQSVPSGCNPAAA